MTGLDVFVLICWCALACIPAGVGLAILGLFAATVRRTWQRAGEQVWQDRMEKWKAQQ